MQVCVVIIAAANRLTGQGVWKREGRTRGPRAGGDEAGLPRTGSPLKQIIDWRQNHLGDPP